MEKIRKCTECSDEFRVKPLGQARTTCSATCMSARAARRKRERYCPGSHKRPFAEKYGKVSPSQRAKQRMLAITDQLEAHGVVVEPQQQIAAAEKILTERAEPVARVTPAERWEAARRVAIERGHASVAALARAHAIPYNVVDYKLRTGHVGVGERLYRDTGKTMTQLLEEAGLLAIVKVKPGEIGRNGTKANVAKSPPAAKDEEE